MRFLRERDLTAAARLVPDLAADLVERVGREHHDMKRIDAAHRIGERSATGPAIQDAMSQDTNSSCLQRSSPSSSRKALDGLAVAAGGRPDQPAAVVIDDNGQVALPAAMAYLINADPPQPGEQIDLALRLIGDAFADPADRSPRDTHQLRNRGLGAVDGQPRRLVLERAREPRVVTRPRHRADHDTVATARHPRRFGLHERERRAEIQRAPAPPAVSKIETGTAAPADTAPIMLPPPRPGRHDDLSLIADPHVLDDRPHQAQQPRPYPCAAHVASAPLDSSPEEAGTLGAARRAPFYSDLTDPRQQQERPKWARRVSNLRPLACEASREG